MMSRGQEQSYPGYLHPLRTQRLVVLGHVNESSEYAMAPLPSVHSIGLELLILRDATLKFRQPMVLTVEPPACLGELVHSGPRFCKVLSSWMDLKQRDGGNINSMRMTITLLRDGLLQINGRHGFNTTESVKSKRHSRTISSTCTNARGGLAAIGEVIILVWLRKDMFGSKSGLFFVKSRGGYFCWSSLRTVNNHGVSMLCILPPLPPCPSLSILSSSTFRWRPLHLGRHRIRWLQWLPNWFSCF